MNMAFSLLLLHSNMCRTHEMDGTDHHLARTGVSENAAVTQTYPEYHYSLRNILERILNLQESVYLVFLLDMAQCKVFS